MIKVFSTYVEVFPSASSPWGMRMCLLHVRGGVSSGMPSACWPVLSSPRTWRCFLRRFSTVCEEAVFSTCVEVFPTLRRNGSGRRGLLHVRGGVSTPTAYGDGATASSPRMWRCFLIITARSMRMEVFSTYVEVFLETQKVCRECRRLFHICGGVSSQIFSGAISCEFSSVTRGSFSNKLRSKLLPSSCRRSYLKLCEIISAAIF